MNPFYPGYGYTEADSFFIQRNKYLMQPRNDTIIS